MTEKNEKGKKLFDDERRCKVLIEKPFRIICFNKLECEYAAYIGKV